MHELKVVLTDRGGEVFLNGRKVDSIGPGTVGDDHSCVLLVIEDMRTQEGNDGL